jgi:uncharacterized protein YjiS (DUF1127 family)
LPADPARAWLQQEREVNALDRLHDDFKQLADEA